MSQIRGFSQNGNKLGMNVTDPQEVELNFTVDSLNGNGLGLRSIKSNGYVRNVLMNSAASFVGTTHTGTNVVDSISSTAALKVGMPVQTTDLVAGVTIASITSGTAITLSHVATTGHAGATITYQGIGLDGFLNPQPAAGVIMIQFKNPFNYVLSGSNSIVSPNGSLTTSTTSGLNAGAPYVITVLGNTTLTEWQSIGLMPGLTPAVGQVIVPPPGVTGTGGAHTGKVGIPGASGIMLFETLGDPNTSINPQPQASNGGAWIMLQALAPTVSTDYLPPMIATAPNDNSVLAFRFRFDRSSVSISDGGPSNTGTGGL